MSWVPNKAGSTQSMLGSLKPPISPAAYFHGNKSIIPDIMAVPVIHRLTNTPQHYTTGQTHRHVEVDRVKPGYKEQRIDVGCVNMEDV